MNCKRCGRKLAEDARLCSACGEPVRTTGRENDRQQNDRENRKEAQPIKALVVEGTGMLFFICLLMVNTSKDYLVRLWLRENGVTMLWIGLIFLAVSHLMLREFKRSHKLHGIGQVGYLVSCIAVFLMFTMLILMLIVLIGTMLMDMNISGILF